MKATLLRKLSYETLRIRMIEEAIVAQYPKGQMRCPVHLSIGQETIAVGVCANLTHGDIAFSGHRSHGHYLAKGGSLPKMLAELYGKVTGCARGRGGSQHLIDLSVNFLGATPIVAETIPVAVGTALANTMQGKENITVAFLGEAAVEEGITHESFNFASLRKLPILFVCENNLYSVYTHVTERQPNRELHKLVGGHGIISFKGDGNDITEVYQLAKKAVKLIRARRGPVFVEFSTYRFREHCGPNLDPVGYRPEKELESWRKKDPLRNMKVSPDQSQKIEKEIQAAFDFAKRSPFPDEEPSEKLVYA